MARLRTPVGAGAVNHRSDVKYVQFLLSEWRYREGGQRLAVDGIVGRLTSAAITEFQRKLTRIVDGRVDPDGPTIRMLEYLHITQLAEGIRPLDYLGVLSMTPPAVGPITTRTLAGRYLATLRETFG
jgi:peptidoglycan hydrolase-like protein with peptidoglycan-binding domain